LKGHRLRGPHPGVPKKRFLLFGVEGQVFVAGVNFSRAVTAAKWGPAVSILRQSRRLYDWWPLKWAWWATPPFVLEYLPPCVLAYLPRRRRNVC